MNDDLTAAIRQRIARQELLEFAKWMIPGFQDPPHIKLIADLLQQVEHGELRKVCISVPVRHGKSVLCSQAFVAWHLGRNPKDAIILASHSDELAMRNSRAARDMFRDDRWPFPDVRLSSDSLSAGRWHTEAGGSAYAIGVGSSVTGRGANVLVIDDALHDGLSEIEKTQTFEWYTDILVARGEPNCATILVAARFADDDLVGRILNSADGKNWKVVNLPALALDHDVLGRRPGQALWPARMPVEEIMDRKLSMSNRAFMAQFQQQPVSSKGGIFKRDWFENRLDPPQVLVSSPTENAYERLMLKSLGVDDVFERARQPRRFKVQALDAASKTGVSNDFSVLVTAMYVEHRFHVLDVVRRKVEFPDLVRMVVDAFRKHKPRYVAVEAASSGIPLHQVLQRTTGIPMKLVAVTGSKYSRADAISPLFETGRVLLPEDDTDWMEGLVDEFCSFGFNQSAHDDQVDAVVLALTELCMLTNALGVNQRNAETISNFMQR